MNGKPVNTEGLLPHFSQPVWRNSYYEGSFEHRVWRPFADGKLRGAKRRIGAILKSAREIERRTRRERQSQRPGVRNGLLGQIGLDVLEVLYNRFLDYRTGRMDPAIGTIAEAVGHSYAAVHAALIRLKAAGFLQWIRRSRPTDNKGSAGPQVEQVSNAYIPMLPDKVEKMVRHLLRRAPLPEDVRWHGEEQQRQWQTILDSVSATEFVDATVNATGLIGETLKNIARAIDERESLRG